MLSVLRLALSSALVVSVIPGVNGCVSLRMYVSDDVVMFVTLALVMAASVRARVSFDDFHVTRYWFPVACVSFLCLLA